MLVLWQDGSSTSGRIARRLALAPGAVTPLVQRLERRGLLRRHRDVMDARTLHVESTGAGRALERAASQVQQAVERRTGLAPGELAGLREELHALARRMEPARP